MTETTPHTSGDAIRAARLSSGMTQEQAARAVGMTRSHLSLVELGVRGLSVERARRLAWLYGTTIEELYGMEESA